jgi:N-acetylneuraminate synthase
MSKEAKLTIPGNSTKSIYEIMDECALSEEDEFKLMQYVVSKGMIFISTPFSRAAALRLQKWDVPAYKIGSGECNNYPLLELISSFNKPIILSTGMNTIASISKAVNIFRKYNVQYALLHTTNLYPTPNNLVRLGSIQQLSGEFKDAVIGLSDHTISNHACFGAVALGASILERHYTDSMSRIGPDIVCSMDEYECKNLINGVNILFDQRGGDKSLIAEEQITRDFAFASVCSILPIKKGDVITSKNAWVKRPGKGGILAENFEKVLGRVAKNDIEKDAQIKWEDLKDE